MVGREVVTDEGATAADLAQLDLDALSRQVAVYDIKSQLRVSNASVFITGLNGCVDCHHHQCCHRDHHHHHRHHHRHHRYHHRHHRYHHHHHRRRRRRRRRRRCRYKPRNLLRLGIEIAKNICLAGVRSVTVHDVDQTKVATLEDMNSNFYIDRTGEDPGANLSAPRAKLALERLQQLNPSVPVKYAAGPLIGDGAGEAEAAEEGRSSPVDGHDVVICIDLPLSQQLALNDYCRETGARCEYRRYRHRRRQDCHPPIPTANIIIRNQIRRG